LAITALLHHRISHYLMMDVEYTVVGRYSDRHDEGLATRVLAASRMDGMAVYRAGAAACWSREPDFTYNDTCASFLLDGTLWGHAQSDFV